MAFDYPDLRDTVAEPLLSEFGKSVPGELLVDVPGSGAPYESDLENEPESHECTVFQSSFKKADNQGTLVEKNDILFVVSTDGLTVDPQLANKIKVEGTTYQIVRVDPLKPGSTVLLWYVHGRK